MKTFKLCALAAAAAGALGVAATAQAAQWATVISATPVTGSVPVPRQACAEGEQVVQPAPTGAGALIGAVVGGVIGNQFGHGFGRAAATGLGVAAGSAIGNQAELNANGAAVVPVRSCRTVTQYENRIVGYDVVYEYNGQRYTTRTASDPGRRLAIDVRPAGAAPLDNVGPPADYADATPYDADPAYVAAPPAYYAPAPAYYAPAPVYYGAAPYYVGPTIGIGFYRGYGWHHGYYHRHW